MIYVHCIGCGGWTEHPEEPKRWKCKACGITSHSIATRKWNTPRREQGPIPEPKRRSFE